MIYHNESRKLRAQAVLGAYNIEVLMDTDKKVFKGRTSRTATMIKVSMSTGTPSVPSVLTYSATLHSSSGFRVVLPPQR